MQIVKSFYILHNHSPAQGAGRGLAIVHQDGFEIGEGLGRSPRQ
jgi:hypothetical protein